MKLTTLALLAAGLLASSGRANPIPQADDLVIPSDDKDPNATALPKYGIRCSPDAERICKNTWNGVPVVWECTNVGKPNNKGIPAQCSSCECVELTDACGSSGNRMVC